MAKKWKLKEKYTKAFAKNFPDEDELVLQLLFERGIKTSQEADKFFNPDYERDLHNPFLMADMDKAVERILRAIKNKERIFIFGDYDADGICGSVVLADFFEKVGFNNFEIYNPDRNKEGHGLRDKSVEEIIAKKPDLVITIDGGITSYDEVERLNKEGIETIITDHHIVPEKIPPALATLDPKRPGDKYPFKELCGTAVVFKLIQALISPIRENKGYNDFVIVEGWEKWLLGLVAIATVADMMVLEDENRTLVYWGLEVLRKSRRPGLLELFKSAKVDQQNITSDEIAFFVAPRLNAASRIDHASLGVELLRSGTKSEVDWLVGRLEQINIDRRKAVDQIIKSAKEKFTGKDLPPVIVIGDKDWQPGMAGLAATRLVGDFNRPVFVWGKANSEHIKGSCRSDGSVNLVELMRLLPKDLFLDLGGHPMAGGYTLNGEVADRFAQELLKNYKKASKAEVEQDLLLDKELGLEDVNWETYKVVERFEPFGKGNERPIFWFKNLEVKNVREFGNDGIHLEFSFLKPDNNFVNAVGFWTKNHDEPIKSGDHIDLAASFEKNTYNGYDELRLKMADFRRT